MNENLMRCVCAVLLLLIGLTSLAAGQEREKNVVPGDTVLVIVAPEPSAAETLTVALKADKAEATCPDGSHTAGFEPTKHGFTIAIPPDACTGRYQLTAQPPTSSDTSKPPQPELILTPNVLNVQPVVTAVDPPALYQEGAAARTLTFLGPLSLKFDKSKSDAYGISIDKHATTSCSAAGSNQQDCYELNLGESKDGQIKFTARREFPKNLKGKQSIALTVNGVKSQPQTIAFVQVSENAPRNYALAVVAGLVVLVYLLLSAGRRGLQVSRSSFLLSALFLDEETQTYSLSKCQFYAWTLAAILGYVFLAISTSVVQGSAVFPDIPEGLPGIILASAGTAVLATGITSSKGSKGAGAVHPSLADFITNGGVVAPERLQFVVWTVVGIVTFLTITFNSDPLTVSGLPKIPSGFLELMGISSAGYLGGKLARKPGPVIKVISVNKVTEVAPLDNQYRAPNIAAPDVRYPVLTLHLKGENLDPKGSVKVDTQALRGDLFYITGTPDPQNNGFSSELDVTLYDAGAYIKDGHTLTLVNGDSQSADVMFPVDPLKIDSVSDRDAAGNATVTGKNFGTPTNYQWRDAAGTIVPVDPANPNALGLATVQNPTSLTVVRPAGVAAGAKLTLISATRLRAEKTV